jgi:hypothetical protein
MSIQKQENRITRAEVRESDKILTDKDVKFASYIFSELLNPDNERSGLVINDVLNRLEIYSDSDKSEFRRSLRRLQKLGYIYIDRKAIPTSKCDQPGGYYYSAIKFKDQITRTNLATNFEGVIGCLLSEVDNKEKSVPMANPEVGTGVFDVSDLKLNLPWAEGPQTFKTHLYKNGNAKLLLVDSQKGRLQQISEFSRAKSQLNNEGATQYDLMTKKLVASLLEGIMPYHPNSGFKSLRRIGERSIYKGIGIWCIKDVAPNAPRLYFTVKNAGDLASSDQLSKYQIDANTLVAIIVAETDKVNQIETLAELTGNSRRQLSHYGVGSI